MQVDVVLLPQLFHDEHRHQRAVVVFDVLRATTTIAAALAAGARQIQIFGSIDEVRAAAARIEDDPSQHSPLLLCGEERCVRPAGFDLGNSPREFTRDRCGGRTILMSTTNGTRAILAARGAPLLFAAALVNASATAETLVRSNMNMTLLCAGTGGEVAMEDLLGAGAVISQLHRRTSIRLASDAARIATDLFELHQTRLRDALADTAGGRNVINAGLSGDIDIAAQLNVFDVLARIDPMTLSVAGAGQPAFDDTGTGS